MTCTAPVRGHYKTSAAARCPGPCTRPFRFDSPYGIIDPVPPPPPAVSDERKVWITRQLAKRGWTAGLSDALTAGLWTHVTVEVKRSPNWQGNSDHWLCTMLADAVEAMDPGTVAEAVGDLFQAALTDRGVKPWVAGILGRGIAKATGQLLATADPTEQLRLGLLVVAMSLCPRPESCPETDRLALPVVQATLAVPKKSA